MNCPKVLLLGNGINRAFSSNSWDELLKKFGKKEETIDNIPMTLQPIILSNNNVHEKLKEMSKDHRLYGKIDSPEMMQVLKRILEMGFDDIITTNYSYELESAAFGVERISDYMLDKIRRATTTTTHIAEGKYLIRTYNEVEFNGHKTRIWHIHGTAKNVSSIVIGHYYYGNLLANYKKYFDSVRNSYFKHQEEGKEYKTRSWLDAFVLGDVYSVGFGFDLSEFDMWWLLDRKKREKALHGKVYYYAPYWENEKNQEKYKLMECFDMIVNTNNLGTERENYKEFYKEILKSELDNEIWGI